MATPKRTKAEKPRQSGRLIRVREAFLPVIDRQAEARVMTPTELVNQLIREALEHRGVWPDPRAD